MGRTSDARQRLMDAAYDLIWEYSYGAVTIDAICERAGVKKGSFYYFFNSKSDLAVAAIDAWWIERKAVLENLFRTEVAPLDRLRGYFDFIAKRQNESYEANGQVLGCPLVTLGSEICTQDEQITARLHDILTGLTRYFEEAIAEARLTGDLEGGNPALMARSLVAYYAGTLTLSRIENNMEPILQLNANALALLGAKSALALA